ncbi:DUF4450 domain-containing protein [Plebeiibacterium marinum]|uniref:DUF4450 domain-containing protein n=1 Tax=Plebeiibacterium marinum TaxID=2992111 RepID=A0AAE3SKK1_9BACT|nr:DUF4450 domain-containing protein [Plebeiobacterium marinum]MCW3806945.1 DUF4450 domain-containing protein [Plebeiobacterium marinum]
MVQSVFAQNTDWSLLTPELSGTLKIGIVKGKESKWFSEFKKIKKKASEKETSYSLKDELIENGEIKYIIRPLKDSKGAVMKLSFENLPEDAGLIWAYGGASNERVGEDWTPEIIPSDCDKNVFSIEGESFTLYYGTSRKLRIVEGETPLGGNLKLGDANKQGSPLQLFESGKNTNAQLLTASVEIKDNTPLYFCFYFLNPLADYNYYMLPELFESGVYRVNQETEWMKSTPD